jgi:hypothetical protein
MGGVEELYGVKLSDATSVAEIVARVNAKIALVKPGEWVTGSGWDEGKLAEHRYVTAADLDSVAPNNPVWLIHTTGHYGVANSLALNLAHITAATADPAAGTIDRDPHGNPTGVLKEGSAMHPVTNLIPPTTPEQMRQGILYIQQLLHSEGMTAIKDPDIQQIHWDAYKSLPVPAVHPDDGGFVTTGIGIRSRATECLGPISGEPLDMLRMEAMAERMGHDVVGHHPFMPGVSKTSQAVPATRCLEDRLHVPMMTILSWLCKTDAACHTPFSDGRFRDSESDHGQTGSNC